jgi:hypothetical protein
MAAPDPVCAGSFCEATPPGSVKEVAPLGGAMET